MFNVFIWHYYFIWTISRKRIRTLVLLWTLPSKHKGQSSQACLPIGVSVLNREIKYEISLWNDATSHLGVLKIMFLVHFHGNRLVTITFLYFDSYRLRVPLLTPPPYTSPPPFNQYQLRPLWKLTINTLPIPCLATLLIINKVTWLSHKR